MDFLYLIKSITGITTIHEKKIEAFNAVKGSLPLKLEPATATANQFTTFQNLLKESVAAQQREDVKVAHRKFDEATLFLKEHGDKLGYFSTVIESFEITNANYEEFINWLSAERKSEEARAASLQLGASSVKEKGLLRRGLHNFGDFVRSITS